MKDTKIQKPKLIKDPDNTMRIFADMLERIMNPGDLESLMSMCVIRPNQVVNIALDMAALYSDDPSIHIYKTDDEGNMVLDENDKPIVVHYVTEPELFLKFLMLLSRSERDKGGDNFLTATMLLTSEMNPGTSEGAADNWDAR